MHVLLGIGLCLFFVVWLEIKKLDDNDYPPDE